MKTLRSGDRLINLELAEQKIKCNLKKDSQNEKILYILTMCFLIYSCKSYSQDLSLDVNNYYGTWQLQTRDNQDELLPTNNYYIFNTDGTVIERNIGSPDTLYKFIIEKIEDPDHQGTFYSNLLIIDIDDPSIKYSYVPDLVFVNNDNKFYLNLEYQVNLKNFTYIKLN